MILTIVAILVLLWLLGFAVWHVGAIIHILLVIALIVFIWDRLAGRKRV